VDRRLRLPGAETEGAAHTTIEELDSVSADRAVLIVDSSGHLGAANSVAFKAAGIFAATPDPVGGSFARKADGTSLAGPMEETALNAVREKRPPFTGTLADQVATGASDLWASYGQTTAMELRASAWATTTSPSCATR